MFPNVAKNSKKFLRTNKIALTGLKEVDRKRSCEGGKPQKIFNYGAGNSRMLQKMLLNYFKLQNPHLYYVNMSV